VPIVPGDGKFAGCFIGSNAIWTFIHLATSVLGDFQYFTKTIWSRTASVQNTYAKFAIR
jgi:hypothetical protein